VPVSGVITMLYDWFREVFTALMGPLGGAVLVVAIAGGLALRHGDAVTQRGGALAGTLLVVGAALLALLVAGEVALPGAPLAQADFRHSGEELAMPPVEGPISVLVHGELPRIANGESASIHYTMALVDGDTPVLRRSGVLSEHYEKRRVARRVRMPFLVRVNERRIDLPPAPGSHVRKLRVEKLDGDIQGPLHAEVVRGLPPFDLLAAFAGLFVLGGAILDTLAEKRSRFSLFLGFLGVFALALLTGVTPGAPMRVILGPFFLALILGVPLGWLARGLVSWIVSVVPLDRLRHTPDRSVHAHSG